MLLKLPNKQDTEEQTSQRGKDQTRLTVLAVWRSYYVMVYCLESEIFY